MMIDLEKPIRRADTHAEAVLVGTLDGPYPYVIAYKVNDDESESWVASTYSPSDVDVFFENEPRKPREQRLFTVFPRDPEREPLTFTNAPAAKHYAGANMGVVVKTVAVEPQP